MRGLNLPYKKNNPRTVRGALRRGWYEVKVPDNYVEKLGLSFVGLQIYAGKQSKGHHVSQFLPRPRFAFESIDDAAFFTLKWS
jgi:hypothetical protein